MREDRRDGAAVLAGQAVEHREALLDHVEPAGLGIEPLGVAAQLGREVLRLHDERAPAHREPVELTVDALEGVEPARGRAERRPGAVGPAVGIAGDRVHRPERGGTQRLDVSQPVALHAQRGLLGLVRRRLLDLAQLELEQVQLALAARRAVAQLLQRGLQTADLGMGRDRRLPPPCLRRPARSVEHLELRGGQREPAVLVLAVEGDERLRQLAQVRHGRRAPVHERARAALGADAPREHDLLGVLGQALAQLARAGRRAARRRPRRRPPARRAGRCRASPARPATGPARGPARSCPRRSPRSGR